MTLHSTSDTLDAAGVNGVVTSVAMAITSLEGWPITPHKMGRAAPMNATGE